MAQRCQSTPVPLTLPTAFTDYQRVHLRGTFHHEKTLHWWGDGGYHLMTPFRLTTGGMVLVDRGFVPTSRKDPQSRPETRTTGEVQLEGFLSPSAQRHWFDPPDDPKTNIWFVRMWHGSHRPQDSKTTSPGP